MTQEIYRTVVGNDSPSLVITCERNDTAIDVTSATVTLIIKNERTGSTTNTVQTCSLTTPGSGIVTYAPVVADFPTQDRYIGTIKIVFPGGKTEYLPERILILAENP